MEQKVLTEKKKIKIVPVILLVAGIIAALWYAVVKINHTLHYEGTDNAQIESNAVPVIARVAGYIDSVALQDYQQVAKGKPAVQIDSREFLIAVQQAESDLAVSFSDYKNALADLQFSESQIGNLTGNKNVAIANKEVQAVKLEKLSADYARDRALQKEGAITEKQMLDSKNNYETGLKQLGANESQIKQVNTQFSSTSAQIEKAKANVQRMLAVIETKKEIVASTKLRLSYTDVTIPVSGKTGKITLKPGQFVQAGQALFTIVDNQQFWITANFKETQLEHLKLQQPVDIKIDGYPDTKITGRITDFSDATGAKFTLLPPDNATGNFVKVTQRVPVKIEFDNYDSVKPILKAGLNVSVDVKVK